MKIIKPPTKLPEKFDKKSIFLAGSIEQGKAGNWQEKIQNDLKNEDIIILNPRRSSWDDSWIQSIDNPQFYEQVNWELEGMDKAHWIVYYFEPETKSPITLMELGLHAHSFNIIVCCPEGFWRKGNVDIVCEKYNVPQVNTLDDLISKIKKLKYYEK